MLDKLYMADEARNISSRINIVKEYQRLHLSEKKIQIYIDNIMSQIKDTSMKGDNKIFYSISVDSHEANVKTFEYAKTIELILTIQCGYGVVKYRDHDGLNMILEISW